MICCAPFTIQENLSTSRFWRKCHRGEKKIPGRMGQINTTYDVSIVPTGKMQVSCLVLTSKKCCFITFNKSYVKQHMDKPNQTVSKPLLSKVLLMTC